MLRKQLLDSSGGRILTLLRRDPLTADDIASALRVSRSAIRAQITSMERDGVVQRAGQRPGTTRPSHTFELTPDVEQLLSTAYVPPLTQQWMCSRPGWRQLSWKRCFGRPANSSLTNYRRGSDRREISPPG